VVSVNADAELPGVGGAKAPRDIVALPDGQTGRFEADVDQPGLLPVLEQQPTTGWEEEFDVVVFGF